MSTRRTVICGGRSSYGGQFSNYTCCARPPCAQVTLQNELQDSNTNRQVRLPQAPSALRQTSLSIALKMSKVRRQLSIWTSAFLLPCPRIFETIQHSLLWPKRNGAFAFPSAVRHLLPFEDACASVQGCLTAKKCTQRGLAHGRTLACRLFWTSMRCIANETLKDIEPHETRLFVSTLKVPGSKPSSHFWIKTFIHQYEVRRSPRGEELRANEAGKALFWSPKVDGLSRGFGEQSLKHKMRETMWLPQRNLKMVCKLI